MEYQHALKGMNLYLTSPPPYAKNSLPLSLEDFHQNKGGQHQLELPNQNLEYIQDLPYNKNFLVTHNCCNPHQTYPLFFIKMEGSFVDTERYI